MRIQLWLFEHHCITAALLVEMQLIKLPHLLTCLDYSDFGRQKIWDLISHSLSKIPLRITSRIEGHIWQKKLYFMLLTTVKYRIVAQRYPNGGCHLVCGLPYAAGWRRSSGLTSWHQYVTLTFQSVTWHCISTYPDHLCSAIQYLDPAASHTYQQVVKTWSLVDAGR